MCQSPQNWLSSYFFFVLFPGIFKAVSHNFFACEWSRDQVLQRTLCFSILLEQRLTYFVVFGEYAFLKVY